MRRQSAVRTIRVAFLGFGNVGRAVDALLSERARELSEQHGVSCVTVGVASRRRGWLVRAEDGHGFDPRAPAESRQCDGVRDWLTLARPDVVFESVALDPATGEPALQYLREILESGAHAISANKGPVVFGYRELMAIAERRNCRYLFESAVMDGAPVFSLVRQCLPLAGLKSVRGVFTSTATVVLEAMENGLTIEDGIERAQALGIAEADPSYDVDGWDTVVKLCAVGNVLLGADLRPADIARTGVRAVTTDQFRDARSSGCVVRLVGQVRRVAGGVEGAVELQRVSLSDPLAVQGTTLVMQYEADVFPGGLTVTSIAPDLRTTAYGMLVDFIEATRPASQSA